MVMKGVQTEPGDITDPGEAGADKVVPARPGAAGPSRSKGRARGDMVSPNRQVITNAPLVPYGDIPLAGEQT